MKMQNAKFKLFKNKKGINDISIIAIILSIFLITSISINFVNAEFGIESDTFDNDQFEGNIREDVQDVSAVSAFNVLVTAFKLAIFDWGDTLGLPFWLDLFYLILSLVFFLVIARNIWIGGGG